MSFDTALAIDRARAACGGFRSVDDLAKVDAVGTETVEAARATRDKALAPGR